MFLVEMDVFMVWERFTLRGRLRMPLPDDWEGMQRCRSVIAREVEKCVLENAQSHGRPSVGEYLEITKLIPEQPETRWWEFMMRSGVKPSVQWSNTEHHVHVIQEEELLHGEE